eukprot:CAMPEP_0181179410 /NCGR_PEP_ID=MMETSP1096-20121128/6246_1 /TAXON_ID=156174 ORGANISM="Chrysochromulina ericina, Strain CCMP281" /NCGR_SAMPLE_ID=MMETSP1096 /ASSEMBLY_ACC=CAM_ASM_000453 /LENGTH=185 /DNA_ID=CAMNT_0023267759 /DNA_START=283 /DNA_END=839 /DNA_ORIENTATION=+
MGCCQVQQRLPRHPKPSPGNLTLVAVLPTASALHGLQRMRNVTRQQVGGVGRLTTTEGQWAVMHDNTSQATTPWVCAVGASAFALVRSAFKLLALEPLSIPLFFAPTALALRPPLNRLESGTVPDSGEDAAEDWERYGGEGELEHPTGVPREAALCGVLNFDLGGVAPWALIFRWMEATFRLIEL